MELLSNVRCFGGEQRRYRHRADSVGCDMTFSIFLPPDYQKGSKLPLLTWLSGLTCTDENFVQKAGAQRRAAELGLVLLAPDTSPRGEGVPDDGEGAYDLGLGAGFYVNATEAPWREHYQMYDYITRELPALIAREFAIDPNRQSLFGHSMGGHGALTIALRNIDTYQSVSAFAPIVAPSQVPWGQKALTAYLGELGEHWLDYDASALIAKAQKQLPMLVDQGSADQFLAEQLRPELLLAAAEKVGYPVDYRLRDGYDHSYFYIASFIDEHLAFHGKHLGCG